MFGQILLVFLGFVLLLGVLAVLLNTYTIIVSRSMFVSPESTFDKHLPGRTITENGLNADVFCNPSTNPHKAVIILGGSEGGKHWSTNTYHIQALLDQGYCVMVLAYFHASGLPDNLREIPLEYFEKAFQWLSRQPDIIPNHYAVFGGSRGGELALLLASRYAQVKAVVVIDPSSVVFPGSPQGFLDVLAGQHAAWSYQGQPLLFVPWPISFKNAWSLASTNQRALFEQALQNKPAVAAAVIPVENLSGPLLCISDTLDQVWPSKLMCNQVMDRLTQNRFSSYYEHISYDEMHNTCRLETCMDKVIGFLNEHFQ